MAADGEAARELWKAKYIVMRCSSYRSRGTWNFVREVLAQSFPEEAVSLVSFLWAVCTWSFVPKWKEQLLLIPAGEMAHPRVGALTSFR